MKILIVTDMEGVCGVINHDDWVVREGRYYEEGKSLLAMEVNAAVEGFFNAGATEIHVLDGHGIGGINPLLLDNRTYYINPPKVPCSFPFDATFNAMAWVGQHAKAGSGYAHMPHTGWFNVLDCTINGISVGEFGLLATFGSYFGVKPIFASGDEALAKEASAFAPGIETVAVKRGLVPGNGDSYDCEGYRNRNIAAVHMHPEKACILIKNSAEKALRRFFDNRESFSSTELKPPYRKETWYRGDKNMPAYRSIAEHPDDFIKMMITVETPQINMMNP